MAKRTLKTKMVGFKLEPEALDEFEKACIIKHSTKSDVLYKFVHQTIKHSKGKSITLDELRDNKK